MSATVTISGKAGPGITVTSKTFSGLTGVLILPDRKIVQLITGDTNTGSETEIDISGATSISGTISGAAGTLNLIIS